LNASAFEFTQRASQTKIKTVTKNEMFLLRRRTWSRRRQNVRAQWRENFLFLRRQVQQEFCF